MNIQNCTVFFSPSESTSGHAERLRERMSAGNVGCLGGLRCIDRVSDDVLNDALTDMRTGLDAFDHSLLTVIAVLACRADFEAFCRLAPQIIEIIRTEQKPLKCLIAILMGQCPLNEAYGILLPAIMDLRRAGVIVKLAPVSDHTSNNLILLDLGRECIERVAMLTACGALQVQNGVFAYEQYRLTLDEKNIQQMVYTCALNKISERVERELTDETKRGLIRTLFESSCDLPEDVRDLSYEHLNNYAVDDLLPDPAHFALSVPMSRPEMQEAWREFFNANRKLIEETIPGQIARRWRESEAVAAVTNDPGQMTNGTFEALEWLNENMRRVIADMKPAPVDSMDCGDVGDPRILQNKMDHWHGHWLRKVESMRNSLRLYMKYFIFKALAREVKSLSNDVSASLDRHRRVIADLKQSSSYVGRSTIDHWRSIAQNVVDGVEGVTGVVITDEFIVRCSRNLTCSELDDPEVYRSRVIGACEEEIRHKMTTSTLIPTILAQSYEEIREKSAFLKTDGVILKPSTQYSTENESGFMQLSDELEVERMRHIAESVWRLQPGQWESVEGQNILMTKEFRLSAHTVTDDAARKQAVETMLGKCGVDRPTEDDVNIANNLLEHYEWVVNAIPNYVAPRRRIAQEAAADVPETGRQTAQESEWQIGPEASDDRDGLTHLKPLGDGEDPWTFVFDNVDRCISVKATIRAIGVDGRNANHTETWQIGKLDGASKTLLRSHYHGRVRVDLVITTGSQKTQIHDGRDLIGIPYDIALSGRRKGSVKNDLVSFDKWFYKGADGALPDVLKPMARYSYLPEKNEACKQYVFPLYSPHTKDAEIVAYVPQGLSFIIVPGGEMADNYKLNTNEE